MEQTSTFQQDLVINTEIKDYLLSTVKWSKFLAIVGFIAVGFMVIAAVIMLLVGNRGPIPTSIMGSIYLVMSVLYFFPLKYLMNFSTKIKAALEVNNQQILSEGFKNLKSHYKFFGIFIIVTLVLYLLMLIFFAVFASTLFLHR